VRTWVDRFPERFEHELADFKARGLEFELDRDQLEEQGRVVLRGSIDYAGKPVHLELRYPDLFPYLRPEVIAPDLELARHQGPYNRNLCLLDPSTRAWDPHFTGAWLATERVPFLLSLLEPGAEEELLEAETAQGEPASAYFPVLPGTVIFVPQAALELSPDALAGSGRIAFSVFEPPRIHLRGLVAELVEKGPKQKTKVLAQAEGSLLQRFGAQQIPFRWVRLDRQPETNTIEGIIEAIESVRVGFGKPPWHAVIGGQVAVTAAVFAEEVRQGEWEDTWLFAVRVRQDNGTELAYPVPGQRLSRPDLEERLPPWVRLGGSTVSLVGLGSVGGSLALELARSGLSELRGMDFDTVEAGTTMRWPIGLSAAGRLKVGALGRRIAQDYPYTEFKGMIHRLGQSAGTTTARQMSELDILDQFLDGADLVVDASAEIGVQQVMADEASQRGIPQLYVSTTEGAKGGLVARVIPGETGCWMCLQMRIAEERIPAPAADPSATVQPRGCGTLTFVGAGFDILPVIAQGARLAAQILSTDGSVRQEERGDDVFVCSFEEVSPAPPRWSGHPLDPHPDCPVCGGQGA
jgi:ThiF family